ncbi:MAG TPA: response regulator transcription factor [Gallionella sp.]|nr:response regulator transcription factor [Gallionella sp.]
MIRLLVADAQVIVRMGLKQFCGASGRFTVAGESANGDELLATLNAEQFDMIVLDPVISCQAGSGRREIGGADLIKRICSLHEELPILVFTMHDEPQAAKRVLKSGASGFVSKASRLEVLEEAMGKLATGKRFVDPAVATKMMFDRTVDRAAALRDRISERERQIMTLFAQGKGVKTIADELFINSRTVSTHKSRLMQKMNFKSNSELVLYAVECGLVDLNG